MRLSLPEIFEGQPRIFTVAVLLYYVIVGPFVPGQSSMVRPKFPFFKAFFIFTVFISSVLLTFQILHVTSFGVIGFSFIFFLSVFFLNFIFLYAFRSVYASFFIICYQRRAPSMVRLRCKQDPSCSEYMKLAIIKYGWLEGVARGWTRLTNCGGQSLYDPP